MKPKKPKKPLKAKIKYRIHPVYTVRDAIFVYLQQQTGLYVGMIEHLFYNEIDIDENIANGIAKLGTISADFLLDLQNGYNEREDLDDSTNKRNW